MIRRIFIFVCCFFIFVPCTWAFHDAERAKLLLDGAEHYKNGDFEAAVEAFLKITDSGIKNGKLFYNLGNAYMKNDDVGRAVYWYERALKLIPDDPDLRFNIDYAYSLLKDEKGDPSSPVLNVIFFWKHKLSPFSVIWTAIILNCLLFALLTLRLFVKKISMMSIIFVMFFSLVFTFTAFFNYYESAFMQKGIILPEKVPVRSGFTENSTRLFSLHAGTKVGIEQENQGYYKIYYSRGKIGWVSEKDIGII